ncbi:DMP19 family protein [Desulfosporosinus youngiae]|uniref:DNA mimic protein DMP19 C-terminal domain-containing protein n=1 Tax=Desulfosporosinus youngiae DSM 17734 TaxID=768710 RepID=H5XU72_9FIRM|nr:DUF4375 domain-containing protein [Desulfosporosinus youngiae]EHQ89168.1 hypothetical protein DesyoDRAFT_2074 [Desulfosporosinus youngiae DSM 17734]
MENYAKPILENTKIPQNAVYGIYEVLIDKQSDNISLNEIERDVYLICNYEGEINNGGFDQFLFNGYNTNLFDGEFVKLTKEALLKIKANKNAEFIDSAMNIVGESKTGAETDEQAEQLSELDNLFYKYPEDLSQLQLNYIEEHIDLFIK